MVSSNDAFLEALIIAAAPTAFALPMEHVPPFPNGLGQGHSSDERAWTLARALASSPAWEEMQGAVIVVRSSPVVVGLLGTFDAAAVARIEALRQQLRLGLPRLRYVAYPQVETDCEELAVRLKERFGREEIGRMDFAAIPRGGLIVLGMLSYFLDLPPSRITGLTRRRRRPLVVVDDCSVSGIRFGQVLARLPDRPVVFAVLYSHRDLRKAIEERERQVSAVVSARDLHDHAPKLLGSEYDAWRQRWAGRQGHEGYWIGQPEHLAFPWNETDVDVWNPVAGRGEKGWRLVPPELCLKNRVAAAGPYAPSIQRQPRAKGPLGPAPTTLFAEFENHLVVANWATREAVQLTDVAARMWREIVEHGNPPDVLAALAREYDVEAEVLEHDFTRFLDEMERKGFLGRAESAGSS